MEKCKISKDDKSKLLICTTLSQNIPRDECVPTTAGPGKQAEEQDAHVLRVLPTQYSTEC